MIRGHQIFAEHFADFSDCYIAIGGLAAHSILEEQDLVFRATKDFDLILVVEALRPEFFKAFWQFIHNAGYARKQVDEERRQYYRFIDPTDHSYPVQIELFSRMPDIIKPVDDMHITPIPVDEDVSSLSAILMDEVYYRMTLDNSRMMDGIHVVTSPALIILKIKAYLDLTERRAKGEKVDKTNIKKHKNDVFRVGATLTDTETIRVHDQIKNDIDVFCGVMRENPPDLKQILKQMGITTELKPELILDALVTIIDHQ